MAPRVSNDHILYTLGIRILPGVGGNTPEPTCRENGVEEELPILASGEITVPD